jgi:gas vesicle protein
MAEHEQVDSTDRASGDRGGFVALAIVAAAVGAGAALLLGPERGVRRQRSRLRGEKRIVAAAGFLVGAGLTALLTPESGPATRKLLGGTLNRIKVGAIDRIERQRLSKVPTTPEDTPVRSVQELGRDPNGVF